MVMVHMVHLLFMVHKVHSLFMVHMVHWWFMVHMVHLWFIDSYGSFGCIDVYTTIDLMRRSWLRVYRRIYADDLRYHIGHGDDMWVSWHCWPFMTCAFDLTCISYASWLEHCIALVIIWDSILWWLLGRHVRLYLLWLFMILYMCLLTVVPFGPPLRTHQPSVDLLVHFSGNQVNQGRDAWL